MNPKSESRGCGSQMDPECDPPSRAHGHPSMTTFSTPAGISTVNSFVDQILSTYGPETVLGVLGASQDAWPAQYYNSDTHVSYTPHNDAERRAVYSDTPRNVLIKGGEGGGKALKTDTSLPTPMGWITMGEVEVGDWLFDEKGIPCQVEATSPIMYEHQCYEVIFDDESCIVADAEHLWLTTDSLARKSLARRGEKFTTGTHAHLPHCQPKYDPEIHTTTEIYETLKDSRGFVNHAIRIAYPLILPPADLPIDPWVLGAWLGDGSSWTPQITIGHQDQEAMIALLTAAGHRVISLKHPLQFAIDTDPSHHKANPNLFLSCLQGLNLIRNKHIPPLYLRGSCKQRLALLQGLMDTDGYIDKNRGKCEFCTASERLATDFGDLCSSLGIKVTCRKGTTECNGQEFKRNGERFIRYRFSFTPYIPIFRLKRKLRYIKSPGRFSTQRYHRYITDVREHDSAPVKCVAVDSPSHLFLAGRGMIPTHNSVALTIKVLNRIKRGMAGIMVAPDLPHLKKSLWPEFRRWCPWSQVIETQRYRSAFSWEPKTPFSLAFKNGATLLCGGIDEPGAWEGPNVHFVAIDEARRKRNADALKVLTGRARLPGPSGEPSQVFIATTPRKNWLYDYYGPLKCRCSQCRKLFDHYESTKPGVNYVNLDPDLYPICPNCGSTNYTLEDPHGKFKLQSLVITLLTIENEGHIEEGFTEDRALALTPTEERVLLWAEWEDIHAGQRFLPDILLWDSCTTQLPPLGPREPMVIAIDAATGRSATYSDCFGMVGVTRDRDSPDSISVRFVRKWQAAPGKFIDFQGTEEHPGPERALRRICRDHNVVMVTYDPDQLHDMGTRLSRERIAWMFPFTQGPKRNQADTDLLNLVIHRRVTHDGNRELREHLDNADRRLDPLGKKLRIVKREESQKIDLAICLSMCTYQALRLNV